MRKRAPREHLFAHTGLAHSRYSRNLRAFMRKKREEFESLQDYKLGDFLTIQRWKLWASNAEDMDLVRELGSHMLCGQKKRRELINWKISFLHYSQKIFKEKQLKVKILVAQSCPTLCDPRSPPGSSVHGILQARILEWVAIPFSRGSFQPRDGTLISWIAGRPSEPAGKPLEKQLNDFRRNCRLSREPLP